MHSEPTVRDKTIILDGMRFHYRDWGDPAAPPMVLLHAYTSHARSWDTFATRMADRFRVLALDQRGHGESDWATDYHERRLIGDVAAFVEALGLETFSIVGFSIGGSAACGYAALYPNRVVQLVALECFTEGTEPHLQAMRDHLSLLRSLPDVFASPDEAAAAFRPLAPYAPEEELHHWMLGGLLQQTDDRWIWRQDPVLRRPGPPGRLNCDPDELRDRLTRVRCPTLLLLGEESWMVGPTRKMALANSEARVAMLPRSGHWVPLDNPIGFLEVVGGFLMGERPVSPVG